ncbi:putative leukotriene A-4 hydrolase (LTA-4 hydrolase) (Leukotriene A(4) hydrolase), partial [Physocladia obscura]
TVVFLESLTTAISTGTAKFSVAVLDTMDAVYGLTQIGNCEIKCRWHELCLLSGREAIFDAVAVFVTTMGRMKYVRPLYRAWRKCSKEGERRARETFEGARGFYHPICVAMVEKDFA